MKMFAEGGEVEEGEEDGAKEQLNFETPDFHVVIALHPALDPVKQTHNIQLNYTFIFPFMYIFCLLFFPLFLILYLLFF